MCRSHRRCPSSSDRARTRALNTANQAVNRARRALSTANATGDAEQVAAAEQRLAEARDRHAEVSAAYPLPQKRGHDTGRDNTTDATAVDTGGGEVDAFAAAEARLQRARAMYESAKAAGDTDAVHDAEQEALAAHTDRMNAEDQARAAAAAAGGVTHTTTVTGRGNLTITGHTGPIDLRHHRPDHQGNITITGPGGRIQQPATAPGPGPGGDHAAAQAEHLRAHMAWVHEYVADAQHRAHQAAADGGGEHTVVTGDNQVWVNGKRIR